MCGIDGAGCRKVSVEGHAEGDAFRAVAQRLGLGR
jgi:hypothetical protein